MSDPFFDTLDPRPLMTRALYEDIRRGHEQTQARYRTLFAEQRNGFRKIDELGYAVLLRMTWNVPRPISITCGDCGAPWAFHGVTTRQRGQLYHKYITCNRLNPMPDTHTEGDFIRRFFHGER